MQHRLVMEQWMREENAAPQLMEPVRGVFYLRRGIEVHHRSEKKDDNARDNLVACTRLAHRCMHHGKPVNADEAWPLTGLVVRGMSLALTFA